MQDPDSLRDAMPNLHWTMFNIPMSVTKLDAGMKAPPAGASDGPNMRGSNQAYLGPHTPPGPTRPRSWAASASSLRAKASCRAGADGPAAARWLSIWRS